MAEIPITAMALRELELRSRDLPLEAQMMVYFEVVQFTRTD